jgi:hypothetical protein
MTAVSGKYLSDTRELNDTKGMIRRLSRQLTDPYD